MEIWKNIDWLDWYYQVSSLWNVRAVRFNSKWEIIESQMLRQYLHTYLYFVMKRGVNKRVYIHRLVAQYFVNNPDKKTIVNHKNWIKTDNRAENLEWCTYSENNLHAYRVLWRKSQWWHHWKLWKLNHLSKKVWQYDLQWNFIQNFGSIREAWRLTWVNNGHISDVCKWKPNYKTAWWFIWKYITAS